MYLRRAIYVGLALLASAALGPRVFGSDTGSAKPKSSTASTNSKSHKPVKKTSSRKVRGQMAPTPDRISEIQQALAKEGSFTGNANGKWDDATVSAMKNYQGAHGLNPSGRLDAPTLEKLGLGSTTAGVAAPTPPPNSTSRLISSAAQPSRQ